MPIANFISGMLIIGGLVGLLMTAPDAFGSDIEQQHDQQERLIELAPQYAPFVIPLTYDPIIDYCAENPTLQGCDNGQYDY